MEVPWNEKLSNTKLIYFSYLCKKFQQHDGRPKFRE